eukprot:gene16986-23259_t
MACLAEAVEMLREQSQTSDMLQREQQIGRTIMLNDVMDTLSWIVQLQREQQIGGTVVLNNMRDAPSILNATNEPTPTPSPTPTTTTTTAAAATAGSSVSSKLEAPAHRRHRRLHREQQIGSTNVLNDAPALQREQQSGSTNVLNDVRDALSRLNATNAKTSMQPQQSPVPAWAGANGTHSSSYPDYNYSG